MPSVESKKAALQQLFYYIGAPLAWMLREDPMLVHGQALSLRRLLRSNFSIISGPIGLDARREDPMLVHGQALSLRKLLRSNYSIISGPY